MRHATHLVDHPVRHDGADKELDPDHGAVPPPHFCFMVLGISCEHRSGQLQKFPFLFRQYEPLKCTSKIHADLHIHSIVQLCNLPEVLIAGGDPEIPVQAPDHHIGAALEDGVELCRLLAHPGLGNAFGGDLVSDAESLHHVALAVPHGAEVDLVADALPVPVCSVRFKTYRISCEHLIVFPLPEIMVVLRGEEVTRHVRVGVDVGNGPMEPLHHVQVTLVEAGEGDAAVHCPEQVFAGFKEGFFLGSMLKQLLLCRVRGGDIAEDAAYGHGFSLFLSKAGSAFHQQFPAVLGDKDRPPWRGIDLFGRLCQPYPCRSLFVLRQKVEYGQRGRVLLGMAQCSFPSTVHEQDPTRSIHAVDQVRCIVHEVTVSFLADPQGLLIPLCLGDIPTDAHTTEQHTILIEKPRGGQEAHEYLSLGRDVPDLAGISPITCHFLLHAIEFGLVGV